MRGTNRVSDEYKLEIIGSRNEKYVPVSKQVNSIELKKGQYQFMLIGPSGRMTIDVEIQYDPSLSLLGTPIRHIIHRINVGTQKYPRIDSGNRQPVDDKTECNTECQKHLILVDV